MRDLLILFLLWVQKMKLWLKCIYFVLFLYSFNFLKFCKWNIVKFEINFFFIITGFTVVTKKWSKWFWLIIGGPPHFTKRWGLEFCLFSKKNGRRVSFSPQKGEIVMRNITIESIYKSNKFQYIPQFLRIGFK